VLEDQPPAGSQQIEHPLEGAKRLSALDSGVGGIAEHQLERPQADELLAGPLHGPPDDHDLARGTEGGDVGVHGVERLLAALDEHRREGPPRERLEGERPRPGVEIEHALTVEGAEDAEQRLTDAIGRGPCGGVVGRHEPTPPEPSSDDAHGRATEQNVTWTSTLPAERPSDGITLTLPDWGAAASLPGFAVTRKYTPAAAAMPPRGNSTYCSVENVLPVLHLSETSEGEAAPAMGEVLPLSACWQMSAWAPKPLR
jgi:hypothetical protein